MMEIERSALRWGGLAGILAFIVWMVEMPIYGYVDPFVPDGLLRFTEIRLVLGVSTILMMLIAILSIALVLTLYQALRGTNQGFALFGSVMGVIGYIVTAFGDASTFFAFAPLSDLYLAPGASPETQATITVLWDATQGITRTFFFVGALFMVMGFIVLGGVMLRNPDYGRRLGGVSIILGVVGILGVIASLFIPGSIGVQLMGIAVFSDIIFLPIFGWKIYRLASHNQ
jgi:hypothetical protein